LVVVMMMMMMTRTRVTVMLTMVVTVCPSLAKLRYYLRYVVLAAINFGYLPILAKMFKVSFRQMTWW
jgi:hypothetical protein